MEIVGDRIEVSWRPEGIRFCDGCQIDDARRYVSSEADAVLGIDAYVHDWLRSTGLVPHPKPKQRTEADFRNVDIDERGYATFRDGGAA